MRYHERQRRDVHSDETLVVDPRAATKQEADRPWSWRAESVHEALARLLEAERRVIILRHVEGRPWHEVIRAVGRTLWACRELDMHALARLSRWLRS